MQRTLAWTTLLAIAVTACGGAPARDTTEHNVRGPGKGGPVPAIELSVETNELTTQHLPAISARGGLAVVALRDTDGGRGNPNLTLQIRNRQDQVMETIDVLAASDYEQLAPNGAPGPVLEQRIRDTNSRLRQLHDNEDLIPLEPLVVTDAQARLPHVASGQGLTIELQPARLVVSKAHKPLIAVDASGWRVPAGKRCAACDPCENPQYLAMVYKAPEIDNVVVVEIGYSGTDTCWEPGNQLHVVAW